jgi:endo-1,4-beta-xylanase
VAYNGQIPSSGYTEFGFQGTGSGPTGSLACAA